MFNTLLAPRALFFSVFLCCAALMGYALFAQYVQKFEPCMLCMVQRVFMSALGLTALIAALHNPKGHGWAAYGVLCAVWAALGAYIAGRHVYLQSLPWDQLEGCSPSIDYILKHYEWAKVFQTIFIRDQDCGKIDWTFLGQSMPRWVLVWFIAMGLITLWRGITAKKALRQINALRVR
jgi:protein dithiol:quinone oxidoreductase